MMQPDSLPFEKQLDLLAERGLKVSEKDILKLQNIGYYKLKEFARPFATTTKKEGIVTINYNGTTFSEVLTRYYQDKNLRLHLLHAIEKVEIAVKTKVSYILGKKYGAFGYLNFSNWCDKSKYSKYLIEQKQFYFKKNLKTSISRSYSSDVKNKNNQEGDGFPSVWLAIDVLTFGELVRLIEIMSKKNKRELAAFFDCSTKELVSWLRCLHFIRNVCAHNSNVIDIKLKTVPVYRNEWEEKLFQMEDSKGQLRPSNRLAVVFLILKHLVCCINDQYKWNNISRGVSSISGGKEKNALLLGFVDKKTARATFDKTIPKETAIIEYQVVEDTD